VDKIKTLQMESIPWADLPAWEQFLDFAIEGGELAYYPDADLPQFDTRELVDASVSPKYAVRGLSKLTLKLRLVPGGDSYP
jgi:hypothetical protein